jgi:hypothetical protein
MLCGRRISAERFEDNVLMLSVVRFFGTASGFI